MLGPPLSVWENRRPVLEHGTCRRPLTAGMKPDVVNHRDRTRTQLCQLRLSDLMAQWIDLDWAELEECSAGCGVHFVSAHYCLKVS